MKKIAYLFLIISTLMVSSAALAQEMGDYPLDTIKGRIYYRYTVEKSVGLYRISVNFKVSQEEILRANPELQKRGLRYGEVILIPAHDVQPITILQPSTNKSKRVSAEEKEFSQKETAVKKEVVPATEFAAVAETNDVEADAKQVAEDVPETMWVDEEPAIRLAYLLPFYANAVKRDKNMDRFYDFYAGALIAIDEVQATGQKVEVFTYDVEKTDWKVNKALQDVENHNVDAIVGPAYPQQVALASAFAKRNNTLLLVPFSSQVEGLQSNPYVLQFNPSIEAEADTLARYLATRGDNVHCVLIEPRENETVPASIAALHKALKTHQVPTSTISLHTILADSLDGVLRPNAENIFVFNTEKYTNLQAVTPHLQALVSRYQVTLFSHYSWQKERIVLPQIYTSVFAQLPNIPEHYEEDYQRYFNHTLASTHPRFDLLGYDLTRHLLHILTALLNRTKLEEYQTITNDVYYGAQCNIHYEQVSPKGGYENHNIYVIRR